MLPPFLILNLVLATFLSNMFLCQTCSREFEHINSYNKHQIEHRNDDKVQIACRYSECNVISVSYLGFKQHLLREHKNADEGWYKCRYKDCKFVCINIDILKNHYSQHVQQTIDGIVCPFCISANKKCSSKASYNVHVTKFHNELYKSHSFSPTDEILEELNLSAQASLSESVNQNVPLSSNLPETESDRSTSSPYRITNETEDSNVSNFTQCFVDTGKGSCSEIIHDLPYFDYSSPVDSFPLVEIESEVRASTSCQSTSTTIPGNSKTTQHASKGERKRCSEMTTRNSKKFCTNPTITNHRRVLAPNQNVKSDTIKQYARILISLTSESHATEPVIQTMIDNNYQIFENCKDHFYESISNSELGDRDKQCILDGFKESFAPMSEMFDPKSGCFRSTFMRNKYFDTNFDYVPPQRIFICNPNGEVTEFNYSYVPIFETLKVMLKNKEIREYCINSNVTSNSSGFFDIKDGNVVKDNVFFQQKNVILLGIFQDAFEICSPIGYHKKKHKMIGFYFTILNLPTHLRSKLKNIKLLLLCKETYQKEYGWHEILRILIQDLKRLETEGVTIDCGNGEFVNFKGSIVVVFGDNLGSHSIGGFCESFNEILYICRDCDMTMTEFLQNPLVVKPFRTLEDYDKCVSEVSKTKKTHVKGIKNRSRFDELEHFKVMNPGLPPCLDHDIYEGTASQIRRFINIFPVIVADAMKKRAYSDPVWKMVLALRNVCSLASASAMSDGQVSLFKTYCEEYIQLRRECFPKVKLRPKHKYLMHYFNLIHHFGPLSKNSTLRFEAKHNYFKQSAKQIQNYKDITQTLAVHHERMQSINDNSCTLFCESFMSKKYDINDYDHNVSAILHEYFGPQLVNQLLICGKITFCGTSYEKDMMLCVDKSEYGNFVKCKVLLILVSLDHSEIFFLGNTDEIIKCNDFGVYEIVEYAGQEMRCKGLSIFSHSSLLSPEPFLQTEIQSVPVLLAKYEPFDPQL
ncbi:hypothetical protein QAD02_002791 [Eretmocerus hayati]|uniref:Uncharacterized protein n=1 Tax=Eretmocerus hayati TaxID=131215 RepID=A0ACC2NMS9_9HYME|nr:hypothetical protein QAD02_002791 [Eretmocerus hayati]